MITRIEAYNYRCFSTFSLDLGRYHVLAGANGAGKTTLLDIPVLLGDLLDRQRAADAFLQRPDSGPPRAHTLDELVHCGRGTEFTFALEARLPPDVVSELAQTSFERVQQARLPSHLRYEVCFEVFNDELTVAEEYLFLFPEGKGAPRAGMPLQGRPREPGSRRLARGAWRSVILRRGGDPTRLTPETSTRGPRLPELRISRDQLALGAVLADPSLFPAALWLSGLLRQGAVFFDPDWALLRQAAPPGDPPKLLPSGRNMPWLARDVRRGDPERFDSWIDHVRTALPQVENIEMREREEDRYAYFLVEYAGGHWVTSSGLSDGTLRIFALTLLPYLEPSALPALLVTEEPENGIHPRAIETAVQSLSSLYDSQVWVSTHAPMVLAHTDLPEILAARLDDEGAVTVVAGDEHPQLRDWQGTLDIGTLFAAGVLS